jgi:GTP cyclohydrolase IA
MATKTSDFFALSSKHSHNPPRKMDDWSAQRIVADRECTAIPLPSASSLRNPWDWWREFIEYDPGMTETTFSSVSTDQLVCVSGMRVFSLCEHHLLPMWCDVAIGYIPGEKVLGLSKFARIAHQFAHQLQIQERLGQQIADEGCRITGALHVAIVVKGEHLCMSARGIRTPGTMTSSVMRGQFYTCFETRQVFFQMVGGSQ